MAKGATRADHRKDCPLKGASGDEQWNARRCKCSPRVVGRLHTKDVTLGHLPLGWKKGDVGEFDEKLADLRDPNRRKLAGRSPLLRDWYADWIVDMRGAVAMGKIARRTVDAYEQRWRLHIGPDPIAVMPINAIDALDLRRFVSRKMAGGLSHSYANEMLTPISGMLTDAEIAGYIPSNPCRMPRRARHGATARNAVYEQLERKPPQHLELADMRALVNVTPAEHRLLMLWPMVTGARRGEILAAHLEDILWAKRLIAIHFQLDDRRDRVNVKAGKKREVVLWSGFERLLSERRRQGKLDGFIFTDERGRALSLGSADPILNGALEELGLKEDGRLWHTLRHSWATYLRSEGVRWEAVDYMMGHKPRDMTGRYVHLVQEDYAAVEAAMTRGFGDIVDAMLPRVRVTA